MRRLTYAFFALIAAASSAAADVRFSGYGRFGLDYNDANDRAVNGISETNITSRLRLQIDMSTETDGGVAFGARYRIQAESRDNTPNTAVANGARFYATAGGFTLGVGNILGAIDDMAGLYLPTSSSDTGIDGMGNNSLVFLNAVDDYSSGGTGANGVEVIYTAGGFRGHFSYSTDNGAVAVDRVAAHIAYTFGDWTAAVGIQDSDTLGEDLVVASLEGTINQFGLGIAYGQNNDFGAVAGNDVDKIRIYGSVDIGAASRVLVWATSTDAPNNAAIDGTNYGIDFSYDLGGGVSFDAGYVETSNNQTQVQAGVYFRF
jgi:outer membrane protein OmpU